MSSSSSSSSSSSDWVTFIDYCLFSCKKIAEKQNAFVYCINQVLTRENKTELAIEFNEEQNKFLENWLNPAMFEMFEKLKLEHRSFEAELRLKELITEMQKRAITIRNKIPSQITASADLSTFNRYPDPDLKRIKEYMNSNFAMSYSNAEVTWDELITRFWTSCQQIAEKQNAFVYCVNQVLTAENKTDLAVEMTKKQNNFLETWVGPAQFEWMQKAKSNIGSVDVSVLQNRVDLMQKKAIALRNKIPSEIITRADLSVFNSYVDVVFSNAS